MNPYILPLSFHGWIMMIKGVIAFAIISCVLVFCFFHFDDSFLEYSVIKKNDNEKVVNVSEFVPQKETQAKEGMSEFVSLDETLMSSEKGKPMAENSGELFSKRIAELESSGYLLFDISQLETMANNGDGMAAVAFIFKSTINVVTDKNSIEYQAFQQKAFEMAQVAIRAGDVIGYLTCADIVEDINEKVAYTLLASEVSEDLSKPQLLELLEKGIFYPEAPNLKEVELKMEKIRADLHLN